MEIFLFGFCFFGFVLLFVSLSGLGFLFVFGLVCSNYWSVSGVFWGFFVQPRVGGPGRGWVAERSKALVSGTSLFGGTGSNPVPIITPR